MESRSVPIPEIFNRDLEEKEYLRLFNNNYLGGGFDDIKLYVENDNYQNLFKNKVKKGAGVFSFLSSIAKKSLPFLKKYIFPEAVNFSTALLKQGNTSEGVSKKDLKDLSKKSFKNIGKKLLNSGGFKKRGRRKKRRKRKIKRKINIKKKFKKKRIKKKIKLKKIIKNKKIKKKGKKSLFKIFNNI